MKRRMGRKFTAAKLLTKSVGIVGISKGHFR